MDRDLRDSVYFSLADLAGAALSFRTRSAVAYPGAAGHSRQEPRSPIGKTERFPVKERIGIALRKVESDCMLNSSLGIATHRRPAGELCAIAYVAGKVKWYGTD